MSGSLEHPAASVKAFETTWLQWCQWFETVPGFRLVQGGDRALSPQHPYDSQRLAHIIPERRAAQRPFDPPEPQGMMP